MYFFIFRPRDDSLRGVAGSYLLLCRKVRGWAGGKMRLASMNLTARLIWASQQDTEVQHAQKAMTSLPIYVSSHLSAYLSGRETESCLGSVI